MNGDSGSPLTIILPLTIGKRCSGYTLQSLIDPSVTQIY